MGCCPIAGPFRPDNATYSLAALWPKWCSCDAYAYFSYDLPVGRGRAFGKNMNRAAYLVIGGWQLNGIVSVHGGFPLTESASDASGTNARSARANCVSQPTILGSSVMLRPQTRRASEAIATTSTMATSLSRSPEHSATAGSAPFGARALQKPISV